MSKETNHNKTTNPLRQYARYSGLAFQLLAAIFLGVWLGIKTDQWLGLKFPLFTIVLCMAALIASLIYLIKSLPKN